MTETPKLVSETPNMAGEIRANHALMSEALRMLRLSGSVFLRGEFSAPWALTSPTPEEMAAALCPGADRLVLFHAIIEGACDVRLDCGESVRAEAGEFVILPFGDRHAMLDAVEMAPQPIAELLPPPPWENMQICEVGQAGGRRTRVLCCYLNSGDALFNPLLRALPPLLKVRPEPGPGADWLHASLRYAAELSPEAIGRDAIGSRLPEILLVESLRQYLAQQPANSTGWFAGLADPIIGDALVRIHRDPGRPWTVSSLADEVAVSRSVLAAKFSERLGQSPMRYLTSWRLQVASHLLRTTDLPVSAIATRVGYDWEPAFSRAFKRQAGVAPGMWRTGARALASA